jgi:hypothetical protein
VAIGPASPRAPFRTGCGDTGTGSATPLVTMLTDPVSKSLAICNCCSCLASVVYRSFAAASADWFAAVGLAAADASRAATWIPVAVRLRWTSAPAASMLFWFESRDQLA